MKKFLKGIAIIIFVAAALLAATGIANHCSVVALNKYIESFEPVEYSQNRLVPVMDGNHYAFVSDEDIDIMFISDIHIGGGFWTYKKDKKSIYEVITMLREQKPDMVILGGDNTYCVPQFPFHGGGTFNNKAVAETVINIFEHEGVYFSTVFGNHDSESINLYNRKKLAQLYENDAYEYCLFRSEFTEEDAETVPVPSRSNQFILLEDNEHRIKRLIMLLDTNAYSGDSLKDAIRCTYDTVHAKQIEWARAEITGLSEAAGYDSGRYIPTTVFMHIPIGEYQAALDDLICTDTQSNGKSVIYSNNENPQYTEFISGFWGEEKIIYGGSGDKDTDPTTEDNVFEILSEEMNCVDSYFCGHDHLNTATVMYKGVMLSYNNSIDNIAYGNPISKNGMQRGATIVTVHNDGSFEQVHKNAYTDYGCSTDMFTKVGVDSPMMPKFYRTVK